MVFAVFCALACAARGESLIERGPWSGSVTPYSAMVKAKLTKEGAVARLVLSKNPQFASPLYSAPDRADADKGRVVALPIKYLVPNTQYYYALEIDGRLDAEKLGAFRTFPAYGPASFTFAFASCARTGSTNPVFDTILQDRPLFYMNIGDFHYLNISTNDRSRFRAAYDRVLASPPQARLYRSLPFVYIWDDHDFGGNNSDRKVSSHEAARLTYQEYVPHYPLATGEGDFPIYQSFSVGRVKFVLTDLRSLRDDPKKEDNEQKTMMGARQKAWFKQELLSAQGRFPLIFWVSTVPWLGIKGTSYYPIPTNTFGYVHHRNLPPRPVMTDAAGGISKPGDEDYWSAYATERREIADFIKANQIKGVCILHGDAHMLGADDGSNADFATGGGAPVPVLAGAPLDQDASIKGGPYSQGVYKPVRGEGCFGLVRVQDEGGRITVIYSGRNHRNEEKIALKFTVLGM